MKVTRRHVLAAVACTGAAAFLGAGGLATRWWDRSVGHELTALSDDEYGFVQALVEAWMPPGGVPAISGAEANLGALFDRAVALTPPTERKLFKLLLQALDDSTVLTRFGTYQGLPLEDRTEILRGWLASDVAPLREAVRAVILLASEGYGTHPDVVAAMGTTFICGYEGPH